MYFHARDAAYYVTRPPRYQNDDQEHRNTDIRTQLPAMEALTHRGYVALRLGATAQEPLQTANQRIIDYASMARTDFLDIFLCAHCRLFVGDGDGLTSLVTAFRRPLVLVNYAPLEYLDRWNPYYLFLPKKLWLMSEHRFLTFREIIESGIGRFYQTSRYRQHGIEWMNNTPEEIMAVAIEMDERLNGTWRTTEEDEELQQRFWGLFRHADGAVKSHLADRWSKGLARPLGPILARIGAEFLRQNRELLE